LEAVKLNVALPAIYLNLYDIYKLENDTIKCGEILFQARKIVPDSLAIDVKGYELDYFAMIKDTAKLKAAAIKMFEQYKDKFNVINIVAEHLINSKEYELAQDMIETGLAIDVDNLAMNQQMTYRYYTEALDYNFIAEEKKKLRKWADFDAAVKISNEIFTVAVSWAEKAYDIFKDDESHNKIYNQILVRLLMPVPEDLKEKVDAYNKSR
jgi:hypothetical protein